MTLGLEKTSLRLGIVPLIDAVPLIVARRKGFFERHGLDVKISVEGAWAAVRDKVATGLLDAAHMLAPMPIAATLGVDGVGVPMLTALSLNLNGNAISVSEALYWRLQAESEDPLSIGHALKRVLDADRAAGAPPRVFAHVFPFSAHHYELRYWLAGCGIDPDRDLQLVVIPPPQMVEHLLEGRIDGFCVGAPWGGVAEAAGIGRSIVGKYQIWNNSPEKVLGVTQEWAQAHPNTHQALVSALIESCRWLDVSEHRAEAAMMMVEAGFLDASAAVITQALTRSNPAQSSSGPQFVFHDHAANFPWISHAMWFVRQMQRWGQVPSGIDVAAVAAGVYRPDLYRRAADAVGVAAPVLDTKTEGVHAGPWSLEGGNGDAIAMQSDLYFDGSVFTP